MVIPVPQPVRYGKSLSGENRLAVDSDYRAVVCTDDTPLTSVERTVLNDCPNVIGDCLDVDVASGGDIKVWPQITTEPRQPYQWSGRHMCRADVGQRL